MEHWIAFLFCLLPSAAFAKHLVKHSLSPRYPKVILSPRFSCCFEQQTVSMKQFAGLCLRYSYNTRCITTHCWVAVRNSTGYFSISFYWALVCITASQCSLQSAGVCGPNGSRMKPFDCMWHTHISHSRLSCPSLILACSHLTWWTLLARPLRWCHCLLSV